MMEREAAAYWILRFAEYDGLCEERCDAQFRLRHSGAMRSIEPGISRFPDVQLHI
jgi:hypothetical protein